LLQERKGCAFTTWPVGEAIDVDWPGSILSNLSVEGRRSAMRRFRDFMQHFFNPLHVYCRLQDMGVKAPMAHKVSRAYERYLWRFIW